MYRTPTPLVVLGIREIGSAEVRVEIVEVRGVRSNENRGVPCKTVIKSR